MERENRLFLNFIQSFLAGSPLRFFEARAFLPKSIQSFLSHSDQIQAELTFETQNNTQILWTFQWQITENRLGNENLKWKQKNQWK